MTTQLTSNFTLEELARVSSGGLVPPELVRNGTVKAMARLLQELRDMVPHVLAVIPTSYWRTLTDNERIGGAERSEHTEGRAVDAMFIGATDRDIVRLYMEARERGKAPQLGQLIVYEDTGHVHVSLPRDDGRINGQLLWHRSNGTYERVSDWRQLPDTRRALHRCTSCGVALPRGTSHP